MKPWNDMNLLLKSEKLMNTLNISYSLFECSNIIQNCLLCYVCKKIVKFSNIKKHKIVCQVNICKFIHVDGRSCNKENHKINFHNGFFHNNDISKKIININMKKFERNFNMKEMNDTDEIIAYKTNNICDNLISIVQTFSVHFDIFSKKCSCFLNLKNCQCFRYFLNNIDFELFRKRKNKNVYEALQHMQSVTRKSICVIVAKREYGAIKHDTYSFFSTFRKNKFVKLILLHDFSSYLLL